MRASPWLSSAVISSAPRASAPPQPPRSREPWLAERSPRSRWTRWSYAWWLACALLFSAVQAWLRASAVLPGLTLVTPSSCCLRDTSEEPAHMHVHQHPDGYEIRDQ